MALGHTLGMKCRRFKKVKVSGYTAERCARYVIDKKTGRRKCVEKKLVEVRPHVRRVCVDFGKAKARKRKK